MSTSARTLVVAPAWIGDAVLTQPLLRQLQSTRPEVPIDVLAPAWTAPVFQRMPEVTQIIDSPFRHGELRLTSRYRLGKQLRARNYQQAFVLPNSVKSALLPFFARIPTRIGYVGEYRRGLLNDARALDAAAVPLMVERFAALASAPGARLSAPLAPPQLRVAEHEASRAVAKFALDTTPGVVCLCVGAEYGPAKRWPPQYFAQLAQRLREQGFAVWLIGSAKDKEIGEQVAAACHCVNLCGRTTLDEAIVLLSLAALVISNDSGLMHVAAALDRPLIALYGSSSPAFTPPLAPRARVVRIDLPCSPCFKRVCPLGHFNCMMQLLPQQVLSEAKSLRPDV